jgi:glycosyltransferase involved in cell wall biosynthesis
MVKIPNANDYSDFIRRHGISDRRPLVSYITVCFNREKTIRKAIESVLAQSDTDYELIVIDGGSRDQTLAILKSFGTRITKLVSEKDGGIYDAFNRGLSLASGRWINFVNSDDWIAPDTLAKFKAIIAGIPTQPDVICGRTRFLSADGRGYVFDASPELLKKESTIGHQAAYVRKSVYDELGFFRTDLKFASDYEFFLRCQIAGKNFVTVSIELANMSADGASDKNWPILYSEITRVQKELLGVGISADVRLLQRLVRTAASRTLSRVGLEPLVALYRKYLSPLKKTRI